MVSNLRAMVFITLSFSATSMFAQQAPRARVVVNSHGMSSGYLGVGVEDVDSDRARALNLHEEHGAEIKHVEDGSPAAKAGLKEGDVVLDYNGQRVEGVHQFIRMVSETPAGRRCTLNVWRNNQNVTLTATIAGRAGHGMSDDDEMSWIGVPRPAMPAMPATPAMPPMPNMPRLSEMPPMPAIPALPGFGWQSAMLGIESEELNPQLAEYFGVKEGVLVRSVIRNSPAEKAGLKAGDVILRIDGTPVSSPREISSIMRSSRSKRSTTVTLNRQRREMTLEVKRPEQSRRASDPFEVPM